MTDPKDFLPPWWAASPMVHALQAANERQLEKLHEAEADLMAQMDPRTATWALDRWEQAYGIAVDPSRSLDFRRSRLLAKLRGRGTSTVGQIRDVASSYTDMDVEVEEHSADYAVEIRFVGTIGSPANLEDLSRSLIDFLPAHLQYRYQFLHNLGDMVSKFGFFINVGDEMHIEQEAIT